MQMIVTLANKSCDVEKRLFIILFVIKATGLELCAQLNWNCFVSVSFQLCAQL